MSKKFDEIWAILQFVGEAQRELAEQQKVTDERLAKKSEEFAEQQKKLAEQQKVTDERLAKKSEEFAEQQKELTEQHKATDALLKRLAKQIGGMSNNDGEVAEEFFWNALKDKKEINGIVIEYSDKNVYRKRGNIQDEFDILLWNGHSVIIVETKYKVHSDAIKNLKEKKIPNFRRLFADKSEQKVYAAIAGFSIPNEVAKEAKENGFFVFRQSGENLLIESDELKVY